MGDSVINNNVNKLRFRSSIQENKLSNLGEEVGKIVNYSVPLDDGEYRKTAWFDVIRTREAYCDNIVCHETAQVSDVRFKKNIIKIDDCLEKIKKLRGVTYDWIDEGKKTKGFKKGSKSIGVIAQEIEEVFPDLVLTDKNGYKVVCYDKISAVLIEAIKDLSDKLLVIDCELDKLFLNKSRDDSSVDKMISELKNFQKENGNEYYFNKMKIIENKYYMNFLKFMKQNEELNNKNKVNLKKLSKINNLINKKEKDLLEIINQKNNEIKELKSNINNLDDSITQLRREMLNNNNLMTSRLLGGKKSSFIETNKKKLLICIGLGVMILFFVYKFLLKKGASSLKMKK